MNASVTRPFPAQGPETPIQLPLGLSTPTTRRGNPSSPRPATSSERIAPMDQRMMTAEVLRVVGVHRATLYRWTRRGGFPAKHASGGWLRSDIESWLSQRATRIQRM